MWSNVRYKTIRIPLPPSRWWAVIIAVGLGTIWHYQGFDVLSLLALMLVPAALAVGDKFELDAIGRRYRAGRHWGHMLNPPWQVLPDVQQVLVKPHSYRELRPTKYNGMVDEGVRYVFTVLLSVPHSVRGIVVASVKDEARAKEIAAVMAAALRVPWQQA